MTTISLAVALLFCVGMSTAFHPPPRNARSLYALPNDFHTVFSAVRKLQNSTNSSDTCSLCENFALLGDVLPIYDPIESGIEENLTCADFGAVAEGLDSDQCSLIQQLAAQYCDGPPLYKCDQGIRKAILNGYDSVTPPIPSAREPLVVDVNLIYHSVTELDVQIGVAQIFVWLDLLWKDPRLAWTASASNCSQVVSVRASLSAEVTEIWVPDFDLYNIATGVHEFPEALADVFPDGTVYWRRAGALKAICQFSGLAKMPFDTLGCQFLFGPWNRRDYGQISYQLTNGVGLEFGDFEPTYNEFKLLPERSETGTTLAGVVLFYTFYFSRAQNYYVSNIVIPTVILTYVSFGTFLLDLRVGERLSYGMSLALVVVAQQIVTADLIPVSDEYLWIDKFVGWSFYWVIFGLVESVLVGYMFFIREDTSPLQEPQDSPNESVTPASDTGEAPAQEPAGSESVTTPEVVVLSEPSVEVAQYSQTNLEEATDTALERQNYTLRQNLMRFGKKMKKKKKWVPFVNLPRWAKTYPLRKIDHFFFFFSSISYTIYLIVMFTTIDSFGKGIDPEYYETSESTV